MRKKALIVGLDYYTNFTQLQGCVADARAVAEILERHENGEINFATPKVLLAENQIFFHQAGHPPECGERIILRGPANCSPVFRRSWPRRRNWRISMRQRLPRRP